MRGKSRLDGICTSVGLTRRSRRGVYDVILMCIKRKSYHFRDLLVGCPGAGLLAVTTHAGLSIAFSPVEDGSRSLPAPLHPLESDLHLLHSTLRDWGVRMHDLSTRELLG